MSDTDSAGHPAIRTRAKFYITGLELLPGKDAGVRVNLAAVGRGDRNASWASATPAGDMHMTINNPAAVEQWDRFMRAARETGKQPELYIDISPSEDGWPGDGHLFRAGEGQSGTSYDSRFCGECGNEKDAPLYEWSEAAGKSVPTGKAHPNG